jgi:hypothetical protein
MSTRCLHKAPLLRSCALFLFGVAGALSLCSASAGAQYKQPILSVGFGGGAIVPVGKAQDNFKSGYTGQGFLLIHLGPLPAIRINLAFQKFDYKEALGIPSNAHTNVLSGTGGLQINLLPAPVRPYITAGIGAFNIQSVADSTGGASTSQSKVHFGVDGGAGLAVTIGRVSAFGEGRVQNIYTNDTGVINKKSITQVPILFGILIGL